MGDLNFNLDSVEAVEYPVLPDGMYKLQVIEGEVRSNEQSQEKFVSLTTEVIEGKSKGRRLFKSFTTESGDLEKQTKGRSAFAKFCQACGKTSGIVENVSDLFFIPVLGKVGSYLSTKTGKPANGINAFYPADSDKGKEVKPAVQQSFGDTEVPF